MLKRFKIILKYLVCFKEEKYKNANNSSTYENEILEVSLLCNRVIFPYTHPTFDPNNELIFIK
jgi:hypothetical protein